MLRKIVKNYTPVGYDKKSEILFKTGRSYESTVIYYMRKNDNYISWITTLEEHETS